ncbi:hypothetical protein [Haloglomus litoreum]|uniref:hypothetical protein n=1 Tax=Haloglomus litoreum TaxID=3034026 RepID=UPI0023E82C7A|nr:hypothetical protein [Haloglomus sp. DT116]
MDDRSLGSRLAGFAVAVAMVLGLLWLGAWVLDVALGPFTPLVTAVVVASVVLLVLRRDG